MRLWVRMGFVLILFLWNEFFTVRHVGTGRDACVVPLMVKFYVNRSAPLPFPTSDSPAELIPRLCEDVVPIVQHKCQQGKKTLARLRASVIYPKIIKMSPNIIKQKNPAKKY